MGIEGSGEAGDAGGAAGHIDWVELVITLHVMHREFTLYVVGVRSGLELDRPVGDCCSDLGG